MEKLDNGKMLLKSDEYIPKSMGRKLIVFIVTMAVLLIAYVLSKAMNIGADKLEIICKWSVISGGTFTGGNAAIAGVSQIANAIKKKNGI